MKQIINPNLKKIQKVYKVKLKNMKYLILKNI